MAQSDLNASNWALRLIGHRESIVVLATDTSTAAVACRDMIEDCRKFLLRTYPWNFATKRRKLQPFQNIAVSNVTFVSSELIQVTHAALTLAAGNYVTLSGIEGATGALGTWEVSSQPTPTTVTNLIAIGVTTSDLLGTYVASATDYIRRSPAFDFSYLYTSPTDMLRLLDINDQFSSNLWRVEGNQILSDESFLNLRYVYDVTDYLLMDIQFYQALAHYLAYSLCDHITASDGKKNELHAYLFGGQGKKGLLSMARFADAVEDPSPEIEANDWLSARYGQSVDLSRLG